THEPECAVKKAVKQGDISESRYLSYLKILEDDNDKYRR
ncbi:MAG: ribosome small subunit-dependent GTPase A, partial [Prevotellaceae bacterium]|nr:ribosome small subunit-dependent GTPase A [Prevotellaceae bacterium]